MCQRIHKLIHITRVHEFRRDTLIEGIRIGRVDAIKEFSFQVIASEKIPIKDIPRVNELADKGIVVHLVSLVFKNSKVANLILNGLSGARGLTPGALAGY
ncbi:hypothetical protein Tco_0765662 [Tanacetum coccineum]